jgi:Fanconi-associated nuclease 1
MKLCQQGNKRELNQPCEQLAKRVKIGYQHQLDVCIEAVLSAEEFLVPYSWLRDYLRCPSEFKLIYTRLFNRKYGFIRVNKLKYDEYTRQEIEFIIYELQKMSLICLKDPDLQEAIPLLTVDEIKQILSRFSIKWAGKRQDLIAALLKIEERDLLVALILDTIGATLVLNHEQREVVQKCFVIYQRLLDWPDDDAFMTTSILASLQDEERRRPFVNTKFTRLELFWPTKQDFDDYFYALKIYGLVRNLMNQNKFNSVIEIYKAYKEEYRLLLEKEVHVTGIQWFGSFTRASVFTRMMCKISTAHFRLKDYETCVHILMQLISQNKYCLSKRGYWYDELTKLLEVYIDKSLAKKYCKEAILDPFVLTGNRYQIIKRIMRISKNRIYREFMNTTRVRTIKARYASSKTNRVQLKSIVSEKLVTVEQYALEYYSQFGWKGYHSENSIILTLFGILFWDIIFDDSIPGVFNSPYQSCPLDFKTEFFYESRKEKIDSRITDIKVGNAAKIIVSISEKEASMNTICIGVNWNTFSTFDLIEIAECIGYESLSFICEALCKHYWAYAGGMPDLILWNDNGESLFVEVKSKNDQLSSSQENWLNDLKRWGVAVEVLKILPQN